ncbi:MAG: VWA domain-containing protein [Planctomycetales bacterium]|nr:VWA domain-containing protein [Planctomycetales bacterium]
MKSLAKWLCAVCVAAVVWHGFHLRAQDGSAAKSGPAKAANRARTATAKGKPFPVKQLVGCLKSPAEETRLLGLSQLTDETFQNAAVTEAVLGFIERHGKDRTVAMSVVRAIQISGRVEHPEIATRLGALLATVEPQVAIIIADVLSSAKQPGAIESVVALAERPEFAKSYGLRRTVVEATARYTEPAAVDFLVSTVNSSDGQLKYETARHLTRITGQSFGGWGDKWQAWWQVNRSNPLPKPADGDTAGTPAQGNSGATVGVSPSIAGAKMPWPHKLPEFYGVPVYAKKVAFVIDKSRSMESSVEGVSRWDRATDELEKVIKALPNDAEFSLFAFDTSIVTWKVNLVPATDENKREAIYFARRLAPSGKTDCYDGLAAGLHADGNLEAVYFLSDGEPNSGPITDPLAIVEAITAQNAFQRTGIFTFGIDARGIHEEFLKQLSARNWGEYISVR